MEVLVAFERAVVDDVDGDALAGLASGEGDGAAGGGEVGTRSGGAVGGAVGDGEVGGGGLAQDQVEGGGAGLLVNDDIAHGKVGFLAGVDGAVAVDIGDLGVVVDDGGDQLVVGNFDDIATGILGAVELQVKRFGVLDDGVVLERDADRLGGGADGEGQGAVGVVVIGEVRGGARIRVVLDGDGAGGRGAQAHGELGVAVGFADDEVMSTYDHFGDSC